ncbi:MAG: C40 family peptidase [Clostridia bacterium]|nr:C40 family peptidase [Clostridia bacterium]
MRSKLLAVLAAALLIALLVPLFASAESYKATVYSSTMKVYEKASTTSKQLTTLKKGAAVTVTSTSGSWAYIKYSGGKGYCQIKNLKSSVKTPVFTTAKTKIYKTASASSVLCTVTVDYPLYRVGVDGSYYLVEDKDGRFTGYVKKTLVSSTRKDPYAVAASAKKNYSSSGSSTTMPKAVRSAQYYLASNMTAVKHRDYMVYLAQCKLGCVYSTNPNNKTTFSNHSFVKACMDTMGYKIPTKVNTVGHTGKAAYVTRRNLLKGDVVCFDCDAKNGNLVDHIGIYVGKGYFIHASPSAGCVVVSSMSSGYYYKTFCWGRRYVGS